MKTVLLTAFLVSAAWAAPAAQAQMVVGRDMGEQVDSLRYSVPYRQWLRHPYLRHARLVVVQPTFPAPQPFGWLSCCQ